ncbi:MAG: epoxyqueuosine reductase [Lachnospiraceae bacterium]|nr:epoxyqueuosine reductase [Lachnospiraceae bacterium]
MDARKERLIRDLTGIFRNCEGNTVRAEEAMPGCEGLVIFEDPIFGFSSAADPIYLTFKREEVIGSNFLLPAEWLPEARSVISFFLPFTEAVRRSNRDDPENISPAWLHGRIEGQACITEFTGRIENYFRDRGIRTCVPATDPRFAVRTSVLPEGDPKGLHIASNWSERHIAFASGLGTFCLSRGLISVRGVAGRYGSVIVSEEIAPDERPYSEVYEYCSRCGACVRRCPAGAITLEGGKNQTKCRQWMDQMKIRYSPRYGCGKCQTGVPCESGIPEKGKQR